MRVVQAKGGKGWELWDGVRFIGHFHTSRQAWREHDRIAGEAMNRQENVAEWVAKQSANE
jgi:hypothetical protein